MVKLYTQLTLSPQCVPHHHRVPWGPAERMGVGGVIDTQGVGWGYPKNACSLHISKNILNIFSMNSTCVNIACWYHWCFTPQIAGYAGFAPMVRGQILFIPPADLSSAIQMPKIWRDTTRVTSRSRRPTCSLNGHAFYLVNGINGGTPIAGWFILWKIHL